MDSVVVFCRRFLHNENSMLRPRISDTPHSSLLRLRFALCVVVFVGVCISFAIAQNPSESHLPIDRQPANPKLPTLYIIGDSTVRNGQGDGADGQWGWGDFVAIYFDSAKLNVVNWALGGRSSRTFITQGHWQKVANSLKPGDFVMMQFGHNDSSAINDDSRARGTLPGIGEETEQIHNLLTKQHETVHTFGWYLRKYVSDTRAKGATPIICSLVPRKIWKDGKIVRNTDTYAGWAQQVATTQAAAFVDLNDIIATRYDELGEYAVEPLFADPHTHTSLAGAKISAKAVIMGLKSLKYDPLGKYLSHQGKTVRPGSW